MSEEGEGGGKGGGIGKIIILILILLIAAAAAAYYFFLMPKEEEEKVEIIREGPPPILEPQYTDLGTFVVNLKDGKYYLKTNIQLVFGDKKPQMWLNSRIPLVKDLIISHLQTLSSNELRDKRTRILLKKALLLRLNSLFPNRPAWEDTHPIKKILFVEFYTQ